MKSPFPGMDPYLEQKSIWSEVHSDLIGGIRRFLTPILRPKYRVAMEQRTYLTVTPPSDLIGEPDVVVSIDNPSAVHGAVAMLTPSSAPLVGQLPMTEEIKERYLEIRLVETKEVVTVIEVLSPSNKRAGTGREDYEQKRMDILGSRTNLIELDLIRAGRPMPMTLAGNNHYRMVVSRPKRRPYADFYLFSVRDEIPSIPIPLMNDDEEPVLDINRILHEMYDQSAYDLAVDYNQPPPPPSFSNEDLAWIQERARAFLEPRESNGRGKV